MTTAAPKSQWKHVQKCLTSYGISFILTPLGLFFLLCNSDLQNKHIILEDHAMNTPTKFCSNWLYDFREEY
jgi:hypothetical protein